MPFYKIRFLVLSYAMSLTLIWPSVAVAWQSYVTLPKQYHTLEKRGVPITAKIVVCRGDLSTASYKGGTQCELGFTYRGVWHSWVDGYTGQFLDQTPGTPVAAIVDSQDPKIVYTQYDVENHVNVRNPFVLAIAAFVCTLGITAAIASTKWLQFLDKPAPKDAKTIHRRIFYTIVFIIAAITTWQITYVFPANSEGVFPPMGRVAGAINTLSLLVLLYGLVSWIIRSIRNRHTPKASAKLAIRGYSKSKK